MRFIQCIIVLFTVFVAFSQEHPPLVTYEPSSYGAENQNWGISQTSDETMYFANNSGLLEFDGMNWKLYPVHDNSIVRSVTAVDNQIYTGSYMDFGVWKRNTKNVLEYTSLVQQLDIELIEDEQFWNIIKLNNWLVFQSTLRVYFVNLLTNEVSFIESEHSISNIFEVNGILYFNKSNKGNLQDH